MPPPAPPPYPGGARGAFFVLYKCMCLYVHCTYTVVLVCLLCTYTVGRTPRRRGERPRRRRARPAVGRTRFAAGLPPPLICRASEAIASPPWGPPSKGPPRRRRARPAVEGPAPPWGARRALRMHCRSPPSVRTPGAATAKAAAPVDHGGIRSRRAPPGA
jgi:hypothetical protein